MTHTQSWWSTFRVGLVQTKCTLYKCSAKTWFWQVFLWFGSKTSELLASLASALKILIPPLLMTCSVTILTLSPPAVKTQWLSQCQAFQYLVRSSHTLVSRTLDLLNRFSITLACFWKHWMLFASDCNISTLGQWKESLGQTSQSLCSSFSGRTNATSALSLGVA
jgi:hypothetical protein